MRKKQIIAELVEAEVVTPNAVLNSIESGAVNQSYRLQHRDKSYFLKTFELNHFIPTDRQALYFLQEQLADLNHAPRPFYLSKKHDFQLEQWVEHTSLAESSLLENAKIQYLAQTLFDIHQLPIYAVSIDFPDDWHMYMELAAIRPDNPLQARIASCKKTWLNTHQYDQVLCHNDLAMEHVSMSKTSVVFDWEYAACGNRFYDIASCAVINRLSPIQKLQLMQDYSQISGISETDVIEQTMEQMPLVELTNELWFAAAKVAAKNR